MGEQPNKILFLIGGNAGHGKDTFADFLQEVMILWRTDFYSTAYAFGIKKIVNETYGTPWEILNGNKDVKESSFVHLGGEKTDITVRRALQNIGQFHRETFGPTCWAAATLTRCRKSNARVCVVTDARHPAEEVHWIGQEAAKVGFLVIPVRVRRSSVPLNLDHPSESLVAKEPDSSFSFLIENEGTIDDLRCAAEELACAAVLLQKTGKKTLKKAGKGWLVRHPGGHLPYEPLLTEDDAQTLAKQGEDDTNQDHSVQAMVIDMLGGTCV